MDSAKHYKEKKSGVYLGRFVKTEENYPDGPWRDHSGSRSCMFSCGSNKCCSLRSSLSWLQL